MVTRLRQCHVKNSTGRGWVVFALYLTALTFSIVGLFVSHCYLRRFDGAWLKEHATSDEGTCVESVSSDEAALVNICFSPFRCFALFDFWRTAQYCSNPSWSGCRWGDIGGGLALTPHAGHAPQYVCRANQRLQPPDRAGCPVVRCFVSIPDIIL